MLKNLGNDAKKNVKPSAQKTGNDDQKADSRWKQKFIKIWQEGEKKDRNRVEGFDEEAVGPEHFRIGAKLGQGSFGQVYIVEKLNILPNGEKVPTGVYFFWTANNYQGGERKVAKVLIVR